MGIRDIILLIAGYGCVPVALYSAYYGLLAYCWLSFMKPQSLVWDPGVQSARITLVVAMALVFRVLFSEGPKIRFRGPTIAFIAFWLGTALSTAASVRPDLSADSLIQFSKIGVASLLITGLIRSKEQLKWLMILLALCPGIYGVKLGRYIASGEAIHLTTAGPMGMDNNDAAMFIAMGVPLLVFAAAEIANKWGRYVMYLAAVMSVPAVILTASRGGALAMAAAVGLTLWRKTTWWKAVLAGAAVLGVMMLVTPSETVERFWTIGSYEDDGSAMGRLNAWKTATAMANERPLTGVGFGQDVYLAKYRDYMVVSGDNPHAAHSVWFSLLAETGYLGLGLYLCMLASVLYLTEKTMRRSVRARGGRDGWSWHYAAAIQASVITFIVGGTFLSQATFEFIFALCALSVPIAVLAEQEEPIPARGLRLNKTPATNTTGRLSPRKV